MVPTVDVLLVRAQIREILTQYARGVDAADWQRVQACYHGDAVDDHGVYRGDPAGLVAYFAANLDAYEGTLHLIGDSEFVAESETEVVASSPCLALHWVAPGSGGDHLVMVADYDDRFECRDGVWRIARRTVRLRHAEEFSGAASPWAFASKFARPAEPR